jgi:hypothetical protein
MHETGGEQANQSSEAACGRLHSTQTKQARLYATSLVRGRAGYRANRSFFRAFLEIGVILFIIISCIV